MSEVQWDRAMLERGICSLFHYANGLKRAKTKPVARSNKERIDIEADAVAYVLAFSEHCMDHLDLFNNLRKKG